MRAHLRHLVYVFRHKFYVLRAGLAIGPPPGRRVLRHLRWWLQLAVHDWSKFLPSEWGPYVARFYGPEPEPYRPTLYYPGEYGGVASVLPDELIPDAMVEAEMDGLSVPHHAGNIGSWTPELVRTVLEHSRRPRPVESSEVVDDETKVTARVTPAIERAFRVAWAKHIHRGPHHWQHWLLTLDKPRTGDDAPYDHRADAQRVRLEMPERYLREMVADWAGAGRAITGTWDVVAWYEKNQGNIKIHGDTRMEVERLLWGFADRLYRRETWAKIRKIAREIGDALARKDYGNG